MTDPLMSLALRLVKSKCIEGRSWPASRICLAVLLCLAVPTLNSRAGNPVSSQAGWSQLFSQLDVDQDNRISRDEFDAWAGESPIRRRDFTLFDADEDGRLGKFEFAAVHAIDSSDDHAALSDPMDRLARQAMEAIDESYESWNLRPDELVASRQFITNFMASITEREHGTVSGRLLSQADPNQDGTVSRDEAFRFLQIQLGIRWDDTRLRLADGRMVDLALFLSLDDDRSGAISETEFTRLWPNPGSAKTDFAANDLDRDSVVSIIEFARPEGENLSDPIAWFRAADRDLDAMVDRSEMESNTIGPRRQLIESTFSAFDEDGDEKLSLREYRVSMHACCNLPWASLPEDRDGDRQLAFSEFQFGPLELFHLQRRFYFHRLDLDRNGLLSDSEFRFRTPGQCLLVMTSADGRQTREILRTTSTTFDCPDISPDGQTLLLQQTQPQQSDESRIVRVDLSSGQRTELGLGMHPSWSADGQRFACSRGRDSRKEIWVLNAQSGQGRMIVQGDAPRWSPDGKRIAFLRDGALWTYDMESGQQDRVIKAEDHSYRYWWWNGCWSPDSQKMVLRGDALSRSDVVVVEMQPPHQLRVLLSANVEIGNDLSWSPDGRRIVLPVRNPSQRRTQLFVLDPNGQGPARPVAELDYGFEPKTGCITPDGQWYITVFRY